jgi:hypothetical protein
MINPITEMKANHEGIVYVSSRMPWYCELSTKLLGEATGKVEPSARDQGGLEQRVIDLYQALLLYLIKSVGYCYGNRFIASLRDILTLNDWKGNLEGVKAAEAIVERDIALHTTVDIKNYLDKLLCVAKTQQTRLQDIYSFLKQQKLEEKDEEFIKILCPYDPRHDHKRIEAANGGLCEESYLWILETSDFKRWRDDKQCNLLWIKAEPGKGKTKLLCGIIYELKNSMVTNGRLAYFFCQATDSRINTATSVLQGLMYLLVDQRPSLISRIREKHRIRESLSGNPNAWIILSEIFTDVLQDLSLEEVYLIIDALDECVADLAELLELIMQKTSASPHAKTRVKWIVSSRPNDVIEQKLQLDDSRVMLSLEQKENAEKVAKAVDAYIDRCVCKLAVNNKDDKYDQDLQEKVRKKLRQKADGTFLWVSLIIIKLQDVMSCDVLDLIDEWPSKLSHVYQRMLQQIQALQHKYPERCRLVLSTATATRRPLRLEELGVLSGLLDQFMGKKELVARVVNMCGSFLRIQSEYVYFIHQTANEFLLVDGSNTIFPSGTKDVHYKMFSASIQIMLKTLKRDRYELSAFPTDEVHQPEPDPLAAAGYSCDYWVDHLCDSSGAVGHDDALRNGGTVDSFIREKYLYWLEALSLCKSMPKGVLSMTKLEALIEVRFRLVILLMYTFR